MPRTARLHYKKNIQIKCCVDAARLSVLQACSQASSLASYCLSLSWASVACLTEHSSAKILMSIIHPERLKNSFKQVHGNN